MDHPKRYSYSCCRPAPPELVDVIKCKCKAQGEQCGSEACGCHKQHLACTSCYNCSGGEDCCNPYSVTPETNSEEEGHDADDDYFQVDQKKNLVTFRKIATMLKRILN